MGKQTKTLKYPEGLVEIPEGASPRTRKRYKQHNYEVRMKEKKAAEALLAKVLQDLIGPQQKGPTGTCGPPASGKQPERCEAELPQAIVGSGTGPEQKQTSGTDLVRNACVPKASSLMSNAQA